MHPKFESTISLFQNGQLNKAKELCLEILADEPKNFEILHLLGIIAFQEKNYDVSIEFIKKAIEINPKQAEANNNLGIAHNEIKKFNEAIEYFNAAILINPNFADAYNNLGIALKNTGKVDSAIYNWKKSIEINPNNSHTNNNLGNALVENKKYESAIKYYDKAIKIDKNFYEAYFNLGNALQEIDLHEEAIKNYDKAINIKINYAESFYNKGNSLIKLDLIDEAIKNYENAFKIKPSLNNLLGTLIFNKNLICKWDSYNQNVNYLKDEILKKKKVSSVFPSLSIYDSPSLHKILAETNASDKSKNLTNINIIPDREINKKIKIGYYSADFGNHAMSSLLIRLFELHDKSKFELIAFSLKTKNNEKIKERIISSFDKFIDADSMSDKEIVQTSRKLKIDIAVDLMGFTKSNRFGIFVERCAPIQINYLGYPGTLGSKSIDYIIADKIIIPKENEKYYSEKIIYLPNTYQVRDSTQKISKNIFKKNDIGLPENSFVFCCFNKHYKITPNVFDIWMRILNKVDNSILWLIQDTNNGIQNLFKEAQNRNVDPKRIIFANRINTEKHLARHKMADLFIDTFPYTAHTTCSDALWSGLPVITRIGQSFASRVSASLLSAIGLPELITKSAEEYENLIFELSTNLQRLDEIKNKLRENISTKPLFNTELFTKNIELAYKTAYENYLKKSSLKNIII